ncbi:MAG: methyltransferase domain-containing protein [Chloroflexi bacterium]|nr:methyltransferase domain-containing protein [Chloroflexota bacterium]
MSEFVYDEEVAARYDLAVPLRRGEVDFYLELAREAEERGLRTLEVACGTGRVLIPLAQQGVRAVGVDNSAAMLALARDKGAGLKTVDWVEGDMRSFDLGEQFGLAIIPAGSFQLLLSTDDQLSCLRCIHRHLAPGGRFAFEVENPNITAMAEWLTTKRGTFQRNPERDFVDPETGHQWLAWDSVEYHPSTQRWVGVRMYEELDEDGRVVQRSYLQPMKARYFSRYEVEHLLARCGFEPEALYGDLSKAEYAGTSPEMLWVAHRP